MIEAKVKYVDGLQFVGQSGTGHSIVMDGSPKYGGEDSAMRPMELLLLGLGGCSGMDVAHILRKKKQPFTGIVANVKGETAEKDPMRYTEIQVEFVVSGKDVDEEAVKRAVTLSMEKYCPVKGTLEHSANITWSYRLEE